MALPIGRLPKDAPSKQASPLPVNFTSPPDASGSPPSKETKISTFETFLAPSNSLPIRSPNSSPQSKSPVPNSVPSSPVVPVIAAAESEQGSNVNCSPSSSGDTRHQFAPPSSPLFTPPHSPLFTPPSSSPPSPLIPSDWHPCDRSHASDKGPSAKRNASITAPQNKSVPPEKSNDDNASALRQSRRQTRRRPVLEDVSSSQEDEEVEPVDVDDDKEDIHGLGDISTAMRKVGLIVLSPRWL